MPAPKQESDMQLQLFGDSVPVIEHSQAQPIIPSASSAPRPVFRLIVGSGRVQAENKRTILAEETTASIEDRLLTRVKYF